MKPGIYHVRFRSSLGTYGEGLAIFKDGALNGGDPGYIYVGHYELSALDVTARLKIKKWNQGVTSVFGFLPPLEVELSGSFQDEYRSFDATGRLANMSAGPTVTISGRRIADAA